MKQLIKTLPRQRQRKVSIGKIVDFTYVTSECTEMMKDHGVKNYADLDDFAITNSFFSLSQHDRDEILDILANSEVDML